MTWRRRRAGAAGVVLLSVVSACSRPAAVPALTAPPPATRTVAVTEVVHGVQLTDPYRWLEDDSADVAEWIRAQNRYSRSVLDSLPPRTSIEAQLKPLMQLGSTLAPVTRGNRFFYARRAASQERPAIFMRDGVLGGERLVIDPLKPVDGETSPVTWFSPSHDGKLLAYGTDQSGDGVGVLRVLDVDSGRVLADRIDNALAGAQWLPDAGGFLYESITLGPAGAVRSGALHRLGAPSAADALLFKHQMPPNAAASQTAGPSATLSRDGLWLLLSYGLSVDTNDVWLARFDRYRQQGAKAAVPVSVGVPGLASGRVIGDTLFLHTTKGAPRGRVIAVSTSQPGQRNWRDIVPQRDDAIVSVAFGRGTLAVTYARKAATAVDVFDLSGKALGTLALPGIGSASIETSEERTQAYLTFASFAYPPTVFRVDLATPQSPPKYWGGPDVVFDPSSVEVTQVTYRSKDETAVTMFVVRKKGTVADGTTPLLLAGYGALGMPLMPVFESHFLPWFEAGGALAVPNLRGGGEYGEAWHRAGMGAAKQRSIDDLIAAAEWLIANKHTSAQKLALLGQSHGGLIAAAALVARPELFRAVVLSGAPLDMLRYHKGVADPYWIAEYGSPEESEAFRWLLGYSPYHRAAADQRYPAVLLTTGRGDPSVPAFHARKMAARLQASTASDRAHAPILLRIDEPPSDPSALFDLELRDLVDQWSFLRWLLQK